MNILFVGFGDIASRCSAMLREHRLYGIARSTKPVPGGFTLWLGDLNSDEQAQRMASVAWDAIVITLTPGGRDEEAYRRSYVENCDRLVANWRSNDNHTGLVLFVSSTSVYGQHRGEVVDENSSTEPNNFRGQSILAAEKSIRESGLDYSIIRFAGIYGPGRDYLLRQVRAGKAGDSAITNRIHQDDCAGFIVHLLEKRFAGDKLEPVYLACDSQPAPSAEVREWLAARIGVSLDSAHAPARPPANKRCSNTRMLASGYSLKYPDYQKGYESFC